MKTIKLIAMFLGITLLTSVTSTKESILSATWYDRHGARTASGVKMNREVSTCAYNALPMGTKLLVKNLSNNKEVMVVVTDRMGNKSPKIIDLSFKAFGEIANRKQGVIKVKITKINENNKNK